MSTKDIQPFSEKMIRHYLECSDGEYSADGEYLVDEDGDFLVEYEYDADCACELSVWLSIEEDTTYSIRIAEERNFAREDWDSLIRLCNKWNSTRSLVTAYLYEPDGDPGHEYIGLAHYAFFPAGATQQQINDLTDTVIEHAFDFWRWARYEHGR